MPGSEGFSPEMWSTLLMKGGLALMAVAAALGIVSIFLFYVRKKRLNEQLDQEFGKKR